MSKRQLTLSELLEDPVYARWITMVPKITVFGTTPPWHIYVKKKKDSNWQRAKFESYTEALEWMKQNVDRYYDIVINSRRQAFRPPVVKVHGKRHYWPMPPGHVWCPYCRRPTRFTYFLQHHAFPAQYSSLVTEYEKRCTVCGVRLSSIRRFESNLISRWAGALTKKHNKKGKKHAR